MNWFLVHLNIEAKASSFSIFRISLLWCECLVFAYTQDTTMTNTKICNLTFFATTIFTMITKWVVVFQHGMCTARNPTNAKTSSGVNIIFYFFCAFFIRFSILNKTRIFIFLCIFIRQVFFCFFLTICGSHFWYFEKETTKQWNRMWKSKIWRMHGSLLLYSTWISWYFRIQIIISRLFSIWGKRSRIFAISFTYFYYFIALKHFRSNIWIFQMFLL